MCYRRPLQAPARSQASVAWARGWLARRFFYHTASSTTFGCHLVEILSSSSADVEYSPIRAGSDSPIRARATMHEDLESTCPVSGAILVQHNRYHVPLILFAPVTVTARTSHLRRGNAHTHPTPLHAPTEVLPALSRRAELRSSKHAAFCSLLAHASTTVTSF